MGILKIHLLNFLPDGFLINVMQSYRVSSSDYYASVNFREQSWSAPVFWPRSVLWNLHKTSLCIVGKVLNNLCTLSLIINLIPSSRLWVCLDLTCFARIQCGKKDFVFFTCQLNIFHYYCCKYKEDSCIYYQNCLNILNPICKGTFVFSDLFYFILSILYCRLIAWNISTFSTLFVIQHEWKRGCSSIRSVQEEH